MHFSHSAPPINSFREMPCFLLWLSGGLHALLICAFVWGHLPFSGPFRNRVSLSTWYYSLRDCTWEAYCELAVPGHCTCPFALNLWEVSDCLASRVKFSCHIHPDVKKREGERRRESQASHLYFLLVPSTHSNSSSYREREVLSPRQASSSLSC